MNSANPPVNSRKKLNVPNRSPAPAIDNALDPGPTKAKKLAISIVIDRKKNGTDNIANQSNGLEVKVDIVLMVIKSSSTL